MTHRTIFCAILGHSHPDVTKAVSSQLGLLNTNTRFLHDGMLHMAKRLTDSLPGKLSVCFFCNSGSEANDLALRLARKYTGNKDVLILDDAYHGHTDLLIDISPHKYKKPCMEGKKDWVHVTDTPDIYRGEYAGDQNAGEKYALMLKNTIDKATQDGRKISAFILEAMQSCGGQQIYPAGYMKHCFKYVRDAGALCIVDEVQTGFGRVGSKMWAFQLQGDDIEPDIISFGKPMGNGFPVAAVVTTPEIATKFGEGGHEYFNTYGGNPVAAAAALAVWDILEKENLREHATVVGEYLLNEMKKLQSKHEILGHVRGVGLFQGYELVRDRETKEPATKEATEAITRCREKFNILLSTEGPHNNVLKFKPPMCFSKDDAKYLVKCLSEVLSEIERNSKEQNGK
ncbi:hypothetical protein BSL78_27175 [Apostichopus japonicus]|uniref:Ethanolamine-phosphate phospho-lyase n=1 Tax=Stichopus japonicus TaxID=307972 RepID=A0A2G8JJT8_STIJA|nr:hypothetical protein BSL78_27175 [Apostichopus japonicus]